MYASGTKADFRGVFRRRYTSCAAEPHCALPLCYWTHGGELLLREVLGLAPLLDQLAHVQRHLAVLQFVMLVVQFGSVLCDHVLLVCTGVIWRWGRAQLGQSGDIQWWEVNHIAIEHEPTGPSCEWSTTVLSIKNYYYIEEKTDDMLFIFAGATNWE